MAMPAETTAAGLAGAMALLGVLVLGCSTNLDPLVKKDREEQDAGGGAAGAFGSFGGSGHGQQDPDELDEIDPEPDGPPRLTLLHGVTDASVIHFCFAGKSGLVGTPIPKGGMYFGQTLVVDELPGIDLEKEAAEPVVIAADPDEVKGADCQALFDRARAYPKPMAFPPDASLPSADLDGGAPDAATVDEEPAPEIPPVRAARLAAPAQGTLLKERSFLFVASGCIGGAAVTDPSERDICGPGYAPNTPTVRAMFVQLSRLTKSSTVSLQFLNASAAVEIAALRSLKSVLGLGNTFLIADEVVSGQIAPYPPLQSIAAGAIGLPLSGARLAIFEADATQPDFDVAWTMALSRSQVDPPENGHAYTVVYLGPKPAYGQKKWWNGPWLTIVDNSPAP